MTTKIQSSTISTAQSNLSVNELLERYIAGERDFQRVQLHGASLKGLNLSYINLSEANLSCADLTRVNLSSAIMIKTNLTAANLRQANLSGANLNNANLHKTNLKEACLIKAHLNYANLAGAFLTKARLQGANLQKTQLSKAHLNSAELHDAQLTEANLNDAYLIGTYLTRVSLKNANLEGAYLQGADLTKAELNGASYSEKTQFERDFDPICAGMQKVEIVTVEEVVIVLNTLSKIACRYLGSALVAKYWQSSRPKLDWFQEFEISSSGQIIFTGMSNYSVSILDLYLSRKWMNSFMDSCSHIIYNFSELIAEEKLSFQIS